MEREEDEKKDFRTHTKDEEKKEREKREKEDLPDLFC